MPRRRVRANALEYLVADGDPSRVAMRTWALVQTRAIDEITLEPPPNPIAIEVRAGGVTPRVAEGGAIALVGRPWRVAPPLHVDTRAVDFTVRVPGYLPHPVTAQIRTQRRVLTAAAAADVLSLDSTAQLTPGLGVIVQRETAAAVDEIHWIEALGPGVMQVQLRAPLRTPRSAGRAVAPDMFVPTRLPDLLVHREQPAVIRGRAIETRLPTVPPMPAPGVQLAITGVWWTLPSVTTPPRPPRLVAAAPPVYFARAAGLVVERCTLVPSGTPRLLDVTVPAGSDAVVVSDRVGLAVGGGDLLRLERDAGPETEWIETRSVDATADPAMPATVRLQGRTAHPHRAGAPVQLMTVAATPLLGTLDRDTLPGDQTVFLSSLAALASGMVIRLTGGGVPFEYHRVTRLPSTPNLVNFDDQPAIAADGSFTLPPLGRVAQLEILARLAGYTDLTVEFVLDYGDGNDLTLVFAT